MTHPGLLRSSNEDVLEAGTILKPDSGGNHTKIHYVIACDGMGGMKAGETASHITCNSVVSYLQSLPFWPGVEEDVCHVLQDAVMAAHQSILLLSDADFDKSGMGSTLALLLIHNKSAYVLWIGDSRIYLLSKRNEIVGLKQEGLDLLTKDHSINWNLVESGVLTLDQIRNAPGGHVLTQSIGSQSHPVSETRILKLIDGDRFLICTDGVNLHIDTKEMYQILQGYADKNTAIQKMQDVILFKGAKDNFSIGIVDVMDVQVKEPVLTKSTKSTISTKKTKNHQGLIYILLLLIIPIIIYGIIKSFPISFFTGNEDLYTEKSENQSNIQSSQDLTISIRNVQSEYKKLDSLNENIKKISGITNLDSMVLHNEGTKGHPATEQKNTSISTNLNDYSFKKKEYLELYKKINDHYQQYIKEHPKPGIPEYTYMINLELLMGEVEYNQTNNDYKNAVKIDNQIKYLSGKFSDLKSKLSNPQ